MDILYSDIFSFTLGLEENWGAVENLSMKCEDQGCVGMGKDMYGRT